MSTESNHREKLNLDSAIELVRPNLHQELLSADCLNHALEVGKLFPLEAVSFFGFETRLSEMASSTDCALNLTPRGAKMLADRELNFPGRLWSRIREFYELWQRSQETNFTDATSTWLEFDSSNGSPAPNLLFGYWEDALNSDRPWEWIRDTVIPQLMDLSLPAAMRKTLDNCFFSLPAESGDFQIGLMLSRKIRAARLCIFDIPFELIFQYLDKIGWAGNRAALQVYLDAFREHCDFIGLHVDVGEQVFPHIGIEPNFRSGCWSRQPHREKRWFGLFDALQDQGVMTDRKRELLLDWTGYEQTTLGGQPALLLRGLSHIKVVINGKGQSEAKAYFGIAQREVGETEVAQGTDARNDRGNIDQAKV